MKGLKDHRLCGSWLCGRICLNGERTRKLALVGDSACLLCQTRFKCQVFFFDYLLESTSMSGQRHFKQAELNVTIYLQVEQMECRLKEDISTLR